MSQRIIGRIVGAGVLAAALTLAGPGRAEARDFQGPSDTWQWLTGIWRSSVSELWSWSASMVSGGQGPCSGPDGSSCPDASTSGDSGDNGYGADPNG
jgi:hypothetical protein